MLDKKLQLEGTAQCCEINGRPQTFIRNGWLMDSTSTRFRSQEYLEGFADGIYSYEDRSAVWSPASIYKWRSQSQDWLRGYQMGRRQRRRLRLYSQGSMTCSSFSTKGVTACKGLSHPQLALFLNVTD